ncbi:MAG: 30S ribosomal protein S3ae [Candidatus Micrarchaeia archaeon]
MARGDKWKLKSWYSVISPKLFDEKKIGDVIALEEAHLLNRVVTVNLGELTGEVPHAYTNLCFRIGEVKGKTAYTYLIGHTFIRTYLRTLIRRGMSLIDDVLKVRTKDGKELYVKSIIVTASKVSTDTRIALRKEAEKIVSDTAANLDYDSFMQSVLFKKLSSQIYNNIKKIAPIKRVEITKTELIEKKFKASSAAKAS